LRRTKLKKYERFERTDNGTNVDLKLVIYDLC
jgi:hypothetical protein